VWYSSQNGQPVCSPDLLTVLCCNINSERNVCGVHSKLSGSNVEEKCWFCHGEHGRTGGRLELGTMSPVRGRGKVLWGAWTKPLRWSIWANLFFTWKLSISVQTLQNSGTVLSRLHCTPYWHSYPWMIPHSNFKATGYPWASIYLGQNVIYITNKAHHELIKVDSFSDLVVRFNFNVRFFGSCEWKKLAKPTLC